MHLDVKASTTRSPLCTHRLIRALREDRRQGRSPLNFPKIKNWAHFSDPFSNTFVKMSWKCDRIGHDFSFKNIDSVETNM